MLRKGHGDLYKPLRKKERKKKKAKGYEERDIRSSLLILELKDGKL